MEDHTPVTEGYIAATCTTSGHTGQSKCLKCKNILFDDEVIPVLGHRSVVINAKEATCTESGHTGQQICTVCNSLVSEGE